MGDLTVDPPPDERLDELMRAEEDRQRRDQETLLVAVDVAEGVDADRADHQPAHHVGLSGEAHGQLFRVV